MANALEVFLRDHQMVHSSAVSGDPLWSARIDGILNEMGEAAMRRSLGGLNPVAWILWHMARVEDANLATCVFDRPQVWEEGGWGPRLRAGGRGNGFRMSKDEVASVAAAIDLGALRAYRDAVGVRTRAAAAELWPGRWTDGITRADVDRTAAEGLGRPDVGEPRESLLMWWGIYHNFWHLGQCVAIMSGLP